MENQNWSFWGFLSFFLREVLVLPFDHGIFTESETHLKGLNDLWFLLRDLDDSFVFSLSTFYNLNLTAVFLPYKKKNINGLVFTSNAFDFRGWLRISGKKTA